MLAAREPEGNALGEVIGHQYPERDQDGMHRVGWASRLP
jgi:hypothetical protein